MLVDRTKDIPVTDRESLMAALYQFQAAELKGVSLQEREQIALRFYCTIPIPSIEDIIEVGETARLQRVRWISEQLDAMGILWMVGGKLCWVMPIRRIPELPESLKKECIIHCWSGRQEQQLQEAGWDAYVDRRIGGWEDLDES